MRSSRPQDPWHSGTDSEDPQLHFSMEEEEYESMLEDILSDIREHNIRMEQLQHRSRLRRCPAIQDLTFSDQLQNIYSSLGEEIHGRDPRSPGGPQSPQFESDPAVAIARGGGQWRSSALATGSENSSKLETSGMSGRQGTKTDKRGPFPHGDLC